MSHKALACLFAHCEPANKMKIDKIIILCMNLENYIKHIPVT